jgi:hypothetical protein
MIDDMEEKLKTWMIEQFGTPRELEADLREKWHRDYGLIYHFLRDYCFAQENGPMGESSCVLWETRPARRCECGKPAQRKTEDGVSLCKPCFYEVPDV